MTQIELTSSQRRVLTALVNAHQDTDSPITGEEVADIVDRNPGTIRNQMQSLTSLGLVEGIPGPKGGYKPTADAFDAIGRTKMDDPESVTLAREYDRVDVTVEQIDFQTVLHPDQCRAQIHLQASVQPFSEGQAVAVGPTPKSKLVVAGTVEAVDETSGSIILDVAKVEAPVEPPDA
jgi:predicted transcriptional regulator